MQIEKKKVTFEIEATDEDIKVILAALMKANEEFTGSTPSIHMNDGYGNEVIADRERMKDLQDLLTQLYNKEIL